jgi:hypothetical protein
MPPLMKKTLAALLLSLIAVSAFARGDSDIQQLDRLFRSASHESGVPANLLRAVAFVESRWTQHVPSAAEEGAMPPAYGVMGLHDDDWFGHSLRDAAAFIGRTPEELKNDPELNVRAPRRSWPPSAAEP